MLVTADIVVVGLRALAFIAVIQAAGTGLWCATLGARFHRSARLQLRVTFVAAVIAIVLVILQHVTEPARLTASLSGIWDSSLHLLLLQSDATVARAVRVLGLIAVAWGSVMRRKPGSSLMLIGAVLAASSFMLMGHTASHPQRWLLAVLLVIHLLVVAYWFGALLAFLVGSTREKLNLFGSIVQKFSVIAAWLVPTIPIAGFAMAVALIGDFSTLTTPYGLLLTGKVLVFSLLMVLAAINKMRLAPALVNADESALIQFRRIVAVEWLAIAFVLAITAAMTGLYGPD